MPEVRILTEEQQAERTAIRLEATLATLKAALEGLKETSMLTGEYADQVSNLTAAVEKVRYSFHHLSREDMPKLLAQIQVLKETMENLTFGKLPQELKDAVMEIENLQENLSDLPGIQRVLRSALEPDVLTQQGEFMDRLSSALEALRNIPNRSEEAQRLEEIIRKLSIYQEKLSSSQFMIQPVTAPNLSLLGELYRALKLLQTASSTTSKLALSPEIARQEIDLIQREFQKLPSIRNMLDTDALVKALREGNKDTAEQLIEGFTQRIQSQIGLLEAINHSVKNFTALAPQQLDHLINTTERYGKSVNTLMNQYLNRFAKEGGLGGVVGLVADATRTFKSFGAKGLALFAAMETAFRLYGAMQELYMQGRQFTQWTQVPGMGTISGLAEAYGEANRGVIGNLLRSISLRYKQLEWSAYYEMRIPHKEYEDIWKKIKQTGLFVAGSFEGVGLAAEYQKGRIDTATAAQDRLVRKFYQLSSATGLSYNALMEGTKSIMRLTGGHDIERAVNTFIALNEVGNRLGVTGEEFLRWVTTSTEQLKWYGFAVGSNTRIMGKYSQALWEGLVSVNDFTSAVRQFTSNQQTVGIGFITAMQSSGTVGNFLREIQSQYGLAGAITAYQLLLNNSAETIRIAAHSQNAIIRRTAQTLEQLAKQQGMSVGGLIQTARRELLQGVTGFSGRVGGNQNPFLELRVLQEITGFNEKNIGKLGVIFDATTDLFSQRITESITSGLRPLTTLNSNVEKFTTNMLEAGKSIKQYVEGIYKAVTSGVLGGTLSGGSQPIIPRQR